MRKRADFGRFGPTLPDQMLLTGWPSPPSRRIEKPPFYAIHMYPISRKSLGGLQIDHQCRVLDASSKPIPGLYAVGEVTGFGGINGSAGLEGTFLGPSMLQGRIVGEQFARGKSIIEPSAIKPVAPSASRTECTACHNINLLSASGRRAFEHSSSAHTFVRARNLSCDSCHRELAPYRAGRHTIDQLALSATCATCHLAQE
jgi:aspartate oxidase